MDRLAERNRTNLSAERSKLQAEVQKLTSELDALRWSECRVLVMKNKNVGATMTYWEDQLHLLEKQIEKFQSEGCEVIEVHILRREAIHQYGSA